MATLMTEFKSLTRYWWVTLVLGIAICVSGILVFAYPGESYLGLSALFAVLMFVSGVEQLVMAFTERYMAGRSWEIQWKLSGAHQALNAAAAAATAWALGVAPEVIAAGLPGTTVPGMRMARREAGG